MTIAKNKKLSEFGKKGAITRWYKEHKKIIDNLNTQATKNNLILKARLCGFLAGDGTVKCRKENKKQSAIHYEVNFYPDHYSLVESFVTTFEKLYQKKLKVKKEKRHFRIRTKCKIACLDLLKISKFGLYLWIVPLDFLISDELKKEWLKAFFDCEGHVSERQIRIQSVNKKGVYQIKKLLNSIGIESKIYEYKRKNIKWNINYILSIIRKDSRKKFLNDIGFNHQIKLIKLKQQFSNATVA